MAELPTLDSVFYKAHGHGNDYLVFPEGSAWSPTPEAIGLVCHPHRGVGGDGIVVLLDSVGDGPIGGFRLRMFNPDGSEFERSGNGLRVLGAYLYHAGQVGLKEPFAVEVGGDRVFMEIRAEAQDESLDLAVDMGSAAFGMGAVGGDQQTATSDIAASVPTGQGTAVEVHPVSVGNPHCVLFRDALQEEELLELGPALTSHPAFPAGVNVQLATVKGDARIEILIWERGVGRTASSGTSACAVASSAVRSGRLPPGRIQVDMEGGFFHVTVSPTLTVRLEGPVQPVFSGQLAGGFLKALSRGS